MTKILDRRDFLKLATTAGAGLALGPRLFFRSAHAAEAVARRPVLVHVFQRGGMDGLNAVVPHGEKEYYALRKSIAIPAPVKGAPDAAIDLDGRFGLHPALAPLTADWDAKRLAIVHAIGSPSRTRSHFDAQDFMESGAPDDKSVHTGWMNRYLETNAVPGDGTFRAVAVTPTLPRSLAGDAEALAIASFDSFTVAGGAFLERAMDGMYRRGGDDTVRESGRDAFDAVARLKDVNPGRLAPEHGAEYPRGRFGDQMKMIAQLVKADVGLEVAFADVGGWDTHLNEGAATGALATRLADLGAALHAFATDLGERMDDVVVLTLTEFGRTAKENGTGGTDHGHGSVSFLLGGRVAGGKVHGKWPGLATDELWQKRDLAVTTDFRDVLAEVLGKHLGAKDVAKILPGHAPKPVGVIDSRG